MELKTDSGYAHWFMFSNLSITIVICNGSLHWVKVNFQINTFFKRCRKQTKACIRNRFSVSDS